MAMALSSILITTWVSASERALAMALELAFAMDDPVFLVVGMDSYVSLRLITCPWKVN
jgi:hypothetical protein